MQKLNRCGPRSLAQLALPKAQGLANRSRFATFVSEVLVPYGFALLASVAVLYWTMGLWHLKLHVPLGLGGDAYQVQMLVKTLVDGTGFLHNDRLGAPFGVDLQVFPYYGLLSLFLMKCLALVTGDYAATLNLFYLSTYPLTTLTTFFVLRQFKISYAPALLAALLYSFLPYHIHRGLAHLFLAAYFLAPLTMLVALRIFQGKQILWYVDGGSGRLALNLRGRASLSSLLICFGCATVENSYYIFFSACFVGIAGMARALWKRQFAPLLTGVTLVAVFAAGGIVGLSPTLLYLREHGPGSSPLVRNHSSSEIYGMKIAHLVLPIRGHRNQVLHDLMERYYDPAVPLNNENTVASLGLIGSIGFLVLLGRCLCPSRREKPSLLAGLSILNLFGVLLGTIGGLGSIVSLLGWTWIRSYNRVSVFLAFFAFTAVALLLDKMRLQLPSRKWAPVVCWSACAALLCLGIYDQVPDHYAPNVARTCTEFESLDRYVHQIEATLPDEAMVFQLPCMRYPEPAAMGKVQPYDAAFGYLHSARLRWSYGALVGRETYAWQQSVSNQAPEELVRSLAAQGFQGLCVDRYAYPDRWAELEARLATLLPTPPLISEDQRYSFFRVAPIVAALDPPNGGSSQSTTTVD
jgi:phosphoglycerol transferase